MNSLKRDTAKHPPVVLLKGFEAPGVLLTVLYPSNIFFALQDPYGSTSTDIFIVPAVSTFNVLFAVMLLNSMSHVTAQETDESSPWRTVIQQKRFNVKP